MNLSLLKMPKIDSTDTFVLTLLTFWPPFPEALECFMIKSLGLIEFTVNDDLNIRSIKYWLIFFYWKQWGVQAWTDGRISQLIMDG